MIFRGNFARLIILSLIHFVVDFYCGLIYPLPEPTLTEHLGVSLAMVAFIVGGAAIIVNIIQPISDWMLPKKGAPMLLLVAPIAAAFIACIGLTSSFWMVGAFLILGAISIGIVHPEAVLAAHSVGGNNEGLAISIFTAGGFLGFASGGLVAGLWVEHNDQGLAHFWLLGLPVLFLAALVFLSGLHRLKGHISEERSDNRGKLSFKFIFALSVCIAVNMTILLRLVTILLVRSFPDQNGQSWGGAAVGAAGFSGAFAAFLWAYLSKRFGCGRIILAVQFLAIPFLYMILHVKSPSMAPVWAIGFGMFAGGTFPLCLLLARRSHGFSQRMRMGLAMGGAWGIGEVAFILSGKYIDRFPNTSVQPVLNVLNLCWVCLAITAILAFFLIRMEDGIGTIKNEKTILATD